MSQAASFSSRAPTLSLTLMPHRSLDRKGFTLLMCLIGVLCLVPAAIFLAMGAWPVTAFLGLDLLAIYLAFRWNFRAARACEIVELTQDALTIRHIRPNGRQSSRTLNPYWARLNIESDEDGVRAVRVTAQNETIKIGEFLPPDEKDEIARLLKGHLSRFSRFPQNG